MNILHKFTHAHDTVKNYNYMIFNIDRSASATQNEDINGYPLAMTLEQLQDLIADFVNRFFASNLSLDVFLNGYDIYDLLEFSNKNRANIVQDIIDGNITGQQIIDWIYSPAINSVKKLASVVVVNPFDYATPINLNLYPDYNNALRVNNWLDAISFIAKNIHPDSGVPKTWTEEVQRTKIEYLLDRANQFISFDYTVDLAGEISDMQNIINWLNINIADTLENIGNYIDTNQPKLPLIRRNWHIG